MMKKIQLSRDDNIIEISFVLLSIFFGVIISLGRVAADDLVTLNKIKDVSITGCWTDATTGYFTWSSRVLINFICNFTIKEGKIAGTFFMAASMYAIIKSLSVLFCKDENKCITSLFICGIIMTFPFDILTSAGWVATTTSYFIPQACMMVAVVPIKKIFYEERIEWWEFCLYAIALVIAANTEQPCVVLITLYAVVCCYLTIKKKLDFRVVIMLGLAIASFLVVVICPGNKARQTAETILRFPTYEMLDSIDKAELGISTTLKWMFVDNKLVIIFSCMMMTYFVWKRYKDWSFRLFSVVPSAATLLLGPCKKVLSVTYPYCNFLTEDINYYGAFNVASSGMGRGVIQFCAFLIIAMLISVNVILLNDSTEGLVFDSTMILAGTASRAMMGFSPTIYASSTRTFSTLVICIIAVDVHLFSHNVEMVDSSEWFEGIFKMLMVGLIIMGLTNLIGLVINAFA